MELSMRDWLFMVGGLLILVILADGFRRVWQARRNAIRIRLEEEDVSFDPLEGLDLLRGELPSGGARPKTRACDDCESPPADAASPTEPAADAELPPRRVSPMTQQQLLFEEEPDGLATDAVREQEPEEPIQPEVLAIHLLAPAPINGQRLLELLQQQRLEFGERAIFHCYKQRGGNKGELLFSVANLLEPGTFAPEQADQLETLGVVLFMTLPGPARPLDAFDEMRRMAEVLRRALNGELHTSTQEPFNTQAVRSYRATIRRFIDKPADNAEAR